MDIRINNTVYTVDKVSRPAILMEESDGVNSEYYWQPFFVYGKLPKNIRNEGIIKFQQERGNVTVHYSGHTVEGNGTHKFTVEYAEFEYFKN